MIELFKAAANLAHIAISGFSVAVLRKFEDGSIQEVTLETDNDGQYLRQFRNEYESQPNDVGNPYIKP